jgi:hypothetical protein
LLKTGKRCRIKVVSGNSHNSFAFRGMFPIGFKDSTAFELPLRHDELERGDWDGLCDKHNNDGFDGLFRVSFDVDKSCGREREGVRPAGGGR